MARYISTSKIKKLIGAAIAHNQDYIDSSKGATNPQITDMVKRAEGAVEAYRACLEALNGWNVLLNIDAK